MVAPTDVDDSEIDIDTYRNPAWLPAFKVFLSKVKIQSKESAEGPTTIQLYRAQESFLEQMAEGIREGTRHFCVLKARQLGLSTVMLVLDLFWLYSNPGLQGAMIADTADNRENFRKQIGEIMASLPKGWQIPIIAHNRNELRLANGSVLQYLSAGKGKNSGLGRSRALSFVHSSEASSYGDQKGVDSLRAALAQKNPNRLYIFESTPLGFNVFYNMWEEAKHSPSQKAIYLGWWSKDTYAYPEGSEEYQRWWMCRPVLDEYEAETTKIVKELYGWDITPEQWAWYREVADQRSKESMQEEFSSHEHEAFLASGHFFFNAQRVNADMQAVRSPEVTFNGWNYVLGDNFLDMKMEPSTDLENMDLKVWEAPKREGVYVIGVDPAYGRNEDADRSVISVWRCFADKLVQVAEYATPIPDTRQVAWVMAHLASEYRDCIINLEVTGPGNQVFQEMNSLKNQISWGALKESARAMRVEDCLDGARWFLWNRPDSMGSGYAYGFKCLALDTPLPTPDGWTTMGDVKVGDHLFNEAGEPTRVVGVSEVKDGAVCYRLTFDDGSSIVADENHEWLVHRRHWWYGEEKIRKTSQLEAGKYLIRRTEPLKLPDADLPLHPYVLGAWLGDGKASNAAIFSGDQDVDDMVRTLRACGMPTRHVRQRTCWEISLTKGHGMERGVVHRQLAGLGLIKNKHIPKVYLRASVEQRLALLQGLMDTDGSVASTGMGRCSFTTSLPQLAEDFSELVRSLGLKASHVVKNPTLEYLGKTVQCAPAYQFSFKAPSDMAVFRLPRKRRAFLDQKERVQRNRRHRLVKVETIESVPVRCVMVDSPSHLYLAGEAMIPTHNTNFDTKMMIVNKYRDYYNTEVLIARSLELLKEMSTLKQDGDTIAASGRNKDDRVMAACLANYAWDMWRRTPMQSLLRTYAREMTNQQRVEASGRDHVLGNIVPDFFKAQADRRRQAYYRALEGE